MGCINTCYFVLGGPKSSLFFFFSKDVMEKSQGTFWLIWQEDNLKWESYLIVLKVCQSPYLEKVWEPLPECRFYRSISLDNMPLQTGSTRVCAGAVHTPIQSKSSGPSGIISPGKHGDGRRGGFHLLFPRLSFLSPQCQATTLRVSHPGFISRVLATPGQ